MRHLRYFLRTPSRLAASKDVVARHELLRATDLDALTMQNACWYELICKINMMRRNVNSAVGSVIKMKYTDFKLTGRRTLCVSRI